MSSRSSQPRPFSNHLRNERQNPAQRYSGDYNSQPSYPTQQPQMAAYDQQRPDGIYPNPPYDNPHQQFHPAGLSSNAPVSGTSSIPMADFNTNRQQNPPPVNYNNNNYKNQPNSYNNNNNRGPSRHSSHHSKHSHDKHNKNKPAADSHHKRKHHKRTKPITQHATAALGEFVGTTMFLWFAFAWHQTVATQTSGPAANNDNPSATTVLYVSLGYGFSLLVAAWSWYRISGGLFNPAVVLGMVLTGSLPAIRGLWLFPAEILGGIVAAALVQCMFPNDVGVVNTLLNPQTSVAQGVFIEAALTSLLLFTIHMLAAEKSKATFLAPLVIGLSLFVAELAGVFYTGGSLNPARSFGPAVISGNFPTYHWIYWIGPFLGSILAAGYFMLNKWLHYEEANPGQDSSGGDFGRQDSPDPEADPTVDRR